MSEIGIVPLTPHPSTAFVPMSVADVSPAARSLQAIVNRADAAAAATAAVLTDVPSTNLQSTASTPTPEPICPKSASPSKNPTCFVCQEPCVAGAASEVQTRRDAQDIVCRLTVNGIRVADGRPFTSVVRSTHYARPSVFDCHSCGASVCCLCMCRRLLAGIEYVARHPLTCACGHVSLVNEKTVLFLTVEQEHSLYLRCDEWFCPDPLYCPVPTCSAYNPMLACLRQFGKGGGRRQSVTEPASSPTGIVNCVRCDVPICTQCKGRADDEAHLGEIGEGGEDNEPLPCTRPNVHHNKDVERLIQEKGYRKCPQCNITVDRVADGCRQVQCFCGAVFCYSCTNQLEDCVCHPMVATFRSRTVS